MFNHSIQRTDTPDSNPGVAQSEPALPPLHAGTREGRQNAILHMQQTRGNAATTRMLTREIKTKGGGAAPTPTTSAFPDSIAYVKTPETNELYGGVFTLGFISSTGDWGDLEGVPIGEQVTITRNDFSKLSSKVMTGYGIINADGEVDDHVITPMFPVHDSMMKMTANPPMLLADQVIIYKDNKGEWHDLVHIAHTFTVECRDGETVAITIYDVQNDGPTETIEQEYLGTGSSAPPCAKDKK